MNDPMILVEAVTLTVKAKNSPKSWAAGMLVIKSPGILL
jgi:hypothetical protein